MIQQTHRILTAGLTAAILLTDAAQFGQAVQLADGTVYFNHPPQLVKASATFLTAGSPASTYYFTLTLPVDAGESLQRVVVTQAEGSETVKFRLKETRANVSENSHLGDALTLTAVTTPAQPRQVAVVFEPAIASGKTITAALHPVKNPDFSGVYLFGVTAFPTGEKADGQFLGFGRFAIRQRRGV